MDAVIVCCCIGSELTEFTEEDEPEKEEEDDDDDAAGAAGGILSRIDEARFERYSSGLVLGPQTLPRAKSIWRRRRTEGMKVGGRIKRLGRRLGGKCTGIIPA